MEQTFTDYTIVCVDCAQAFTHRAKDQAYYALRGFVPPRRCRECRAFRKAERDGDQVSR